MWVCRECGREFDEPVTERFCLEDEYGVGSLFSDRHYAYYEFCPVCGSDEISEEYEDDEDDE